MRGALLLLVTIAAAAAQDRTITSESEVRVVAVSKDGSTVLGICGTSSLAFSPDGSVLAAGSWDTNLRAWNTRNGELLALIEELPVAMFGIAFSPDGKTLATAGVNRIVYLWDSKTWKLARKFVGQPEMISALAYSPDGRFLATGGFNDITQAHPVSILIWDVGTGKTVRT